MALAQSDKQFGKGSIMKLGERGNVGVEAIPTGALALDLALGIGGLPRGRIVEIFGPESSGKSTLAMHVVAEAQRNGGTCAYIDAEHAMDPVYGRAIGMNVDDLLPIAGIRTTPRCASSSAATSTTLRSTTTSRSSSCGAR